MHIKLTNLEKVLKEVEGILPDKYKRRIMSDMVRKTVSLNRKRVREQKNLDGSSYKKRKSLKNKKKMFKKALSAKSRQLLIKTSSNEGSVEIKNPELMKHHFGMTRLEKHLRNKNVKFRVKYEKRELLGLRKSDEKELIQVAIKSIDRHLKRI